MQLTGNIKILERGDAFTARDIRDMMESHAFKRFLAKIDSMIESAQKDCETANEVDVWRKAQGELKALRTVKTLPQIMECEMESK